ncbi:outer membrane lipid asymmetry maintenance protein MlaD [Candidatus Fukatsuia symbiotica]|uniref:Outer membrane lipid asymmetry maintenance protein MlaD n=1 Tax=Candidatus Fukatsuia symbiotica TaxID=1878942 RepID=A0A2U8IAB4_9GAMM|nr:outer membrane lipid asymmetry maintenance protein MlaD [Candidatus Fukatsuia symbiotica]AWK15055.1 outer membrane lipid asymmetry maintenance protein MlaD [Candidatus Fukatsuia symbiotica]MEA9443858.1 outer membrane lipid asymmetry maintenance protein MlaD [Candidatus Fukatsuia symbiotica]
MQTKKSEIGVGLFVLLALVATIFICLKVAGIKSIGSQATYRIYATFDNVGGLGVNSPVKIGGVVVGRVAVISLDDNNYSPRVAMDIEANYNRIPDSSSLAIRTSGLLGEQFLALNVGFEDEEMGTNLLKEGSTIQNTKSALILEDLIGQLLYSRGEKNQVVSSKST